jgi:hypothetical protein
MWGASHKPRTLCVFDEASGIDTQYYDAADTWAHRKLVIGNPLPCRNFFYHGVKRGDVSDPSNGHYLRKVIKIRSIDSPNVRYAFREKNLGKEISDTILIPGLLSWREYQRRRTLWDKVRQTIGLDGEFYEGADTLLYPPDWLNHAETIARTLPRKRVGKAMGVDAAEGGDSTVWAVVDDLGLIYLLSIKTEDTSDIPGQTIALMREYSVKSENVVFDQGGGGKQNADVLRRLGYNVRTRAFGSSAVDPETLGRFMSSKETRDAAEKRYVYKNARAEMYGLLRDQLDLTVNPKGFGIPEEYSELRRQLAAMPLKYDMEGRMYLPPKDRRGSSSKSEQTIKELIGRSPDDADALVLAVFGLLKKKRTHKVGALALY